MQAWAPSRSSRFAGGMAWPPAIQPTGREDHSAGAAPERASMRCWVFAAGVVSPALAADGAFDGAKRIQARQSPAATMAKSRSFFIQQPPANSNERWGEERSATVHFVGCAATKRKFWWSDC